MRSGICWTGPGWPVHIWNDHDVMSILDGEVIEEIKKIAADIDDVLHNLGREARAIEQGINRGMQVIDGLGQGMELYTRGQFTHFLGEQVGNAVATGFDIFVNFGEGVFKGAVGAAQGMEDLDPRWFLIDPKGAANTWMGMTKTGLLNELLHPQEAGRKNRQMFRSLLHLDDWRWNRLGLGFGENYFDAVTLVTGIGAVKAGASGAGAAARGAEAAREIAAGEEPVEGVGGVVGEAGEFGRTGRALADIGRTSNGLIKELQNLGGGLAEAARSGARRSSGELAAGLTDWNARRTGAGGRGIRASGDASTRIADRGRVGGQRAGRWAGRSA